MIELLLKGVLVYHLPIYEVRKVPQRPIEVLYDVTPDLAADPIAVQTRTHSSETCTHTGQHVRLPGVST